VAADINAPSESASQESAQLERLKYLRALYANDLPHGDTEQRLAWVKRQARAYLAYLADQIMAGDLEAEAGKSEAYAAIQGIARSADLRAEDFRHIEGHLWAEAQGGALARRDGIDRAVFWRARNNAPLAQIIAAARAEAARTGAAWSEDQLNQIIAQGLRAGMSGRRPTNG